MGLPQYRRRSQVDHIAQMSLGHTSARQVQDNCYPLINQFEDILEKLLPDPRVDPRQSKLFEAQLVAIMRRLQLVVDGYFGVERSRGPAANAGSRARAPVPDSAMPALAPEPVCELTALEEYNRAAQGTDLDRSQFLERPDHIRVTAPSRDLAATASLALAQKVELARTSDGMFVIARDGSKDVLFPLFRIRGSQRVMLSHCFNMEAAGVNGMASARVLRVTKPAECDRRGEGWVLRTRGEISLGPA